MTKIFISHSSQDDGFVRELRQALELHGQAGWVDSRELRGGDPLWPEIQRAIDEASAFAVVVSPDALQSNWVGKQLCHALDVQKQRGKDKFMGTAPRWQRFPFPRSPSHTGSPPAAANRGV